MDCMPYTQEAELHLVAAARPNLAKLASGVSGGTHAALTGRTMIAAEGAWRVRRPRCAAAAALAARKLGVPVAHLAEWLAA